MPAQQNGEFKFPDEVEDKDTEASSESELSVEIEDDTPPEDRGREPMPKPLVEELEKDELDQYDDNVKNKLKQMRKVWHDERRAKEEAFREHQEAVSFTQKLIEENKRIKGILDNGSKEYVAMLKNNAALEMENAKRAYKEAYDSGDSDKLVEAQQALQTANFKMLRAENFRAPPLQRQENNVQTQQNQVNEPPQRPLDPKLVAWQKRNQWYGQDDEMTASALGLHEKLKRTGEVEIGSDEYYAILDRTIRKRFPENFDSEESENKASTRTKAGTVVAPAVRSTAPNKIRLKMSQVALAKKLGLTPEQYALELKKLESQNG
jgi:uncharacterized protein (DUF2249 family)